MSVKRSMPCLACSASDGKQHDEMQRLGIYPHDYQPAAGWCEDCEDWVDAEHMRAAGYAVDDGPAQDQT